MTNYAGYPQAQIPFQLPTGIQQVEVPLQNSPQKVNLSSLTEQSVWNKFNCLLNPIPRRNQPQMGWKYPNCLISVADTLSRKTAHSLLPYITRRITCAPNIYAQSPSPSINEKIIYYCGFSKFSLCNYENKVKTNEITSFFASIKSLTDYPLLDFRPLDKAAHVLETSTTSIPVSALMDIIFSKAQIEEMVTLHRDNARGQGYREFPATLIIENLDEIENNINNWFFEKCIRFLNSKGFNVILIVASKKLKNMNISPIWHNVLEVAEHKFFGNQTKTAPRVQVTFSRTTDSISMQKQTYQLGLLYTSSGGTYPVELPPSPYEQFEPIVHELFAQDYTAKQIKEYLKVNNSFEISLPTLSKLMLQWGLRRYRFKHRKSKRINKKSKQ